MYMTILSVPYFGANHSLGNFCLHPPYNHGFSIIEEATSQHDSTHQLNIQSKHIFDVHQIAWKHNLITAVQGCFFGSRNHQYTWYEHEYQLRLMLCSTIYYTHKLHQVYTDLFSMNVIWGDRPFWDFNARRAGSRRRTDRFFLAFLPRIHGDDYRCPPQMETAPFRFH